MTTIPARYGISAGCQIDLTIDVAKLMQRWRTHVAEVQHDATGGARTYPIESYGLFAAWADKILEAEVLAKAAARIADEMFLEEGPLAANLLDDAAFRTALAAELGTPVAGPGQLDIFGQQVA